MANLDGVSWTVAMVRYGSGLRSMERLRLRIRKWARIAETGKFLRVILLADGQTVHNAFFDRSFKESSK